MTKARLSTLVLLLVASSPAVARADVGLLRSSQALDEARGYCLDIAGFGATLRLDDPLQAHTCKYGSQLDDQQFEPIANGAIKASLYDRCLAATSLEPGARLVVRACTSAPPQRWTFIWGRLSPDSRRDLCVSLANAKGEIAGTPALITPVYRRRDVTLERCDDTEQARQSFRWSQPDERGPSSANVVRNSMPADVAKQLASFGTEFDGEIAGQTAKIYASQLRVYEPGEIKVTKNLAYGPHERQQVDIHTATVRRSDRPMPVVVVFHGGGLIGGSRTATTNVADYFASLGYVGVNGGYRLAPDSKWPEGARDVGAAVTWLKSHAAEYRWRSRADLRRWSLDRRVPCRHLRLQTGAAARGHRACRGSHSPVRPLLLRFCVTVEGRAGVFRRGPEAMAGNGDSRSCHPRRHSGALHDRGMGQRPVSVAASGGVQRAGRKARSATTLQAESRTQSFLATVVDRHDRRERLKRAGGLHRTHSAPLMTRAAF